MIKNAKEELLGIIDPNEIKCAEVEYATCDMDVTEGSHAKLRENWTNEDMQLFLFDLDFEYDSGYGSQQVFGTIWMKDGTWFTRSEYDGSEWWFHNVLPDVPEHLQARSR